MSPHHRLHHRFERSQDDRLVWRTRALSEREKNGYVRSSISWSFERLAISVCYAKMRLGALLHSYGWSFFVFSLLMRLPTSMVMLAVMMMLVQQHSEITLGGYAAGTVGLAAALVVPFYRSVSDRWGQRRIFFIMTALNLVSLIWLMVEALRLAETSQQSISRFLVACALTGVTTVPLGAMMRSFWAAEFERNKDRRRLNASISLETMLDIVAFPAGAVLAGLTTVLFTAQSTLFAVMIINALGLLMILWWPQNLPTETRRVQEVSQRVPLRGSVRSLLWLPPLAMVCLGVVAGATQAAVLAFALLTDQLGSAGFLIACLGLCAVLSALLVVFGRLPMFGWMAWIISGVGLTLTAMLLSSPASTAGLIPALVVLGLAYGVCLVAMDSVVTSLTARKNLDQALSTLQTSLLGGSALGYVWSADVSGFSSYQVALLIPLVAAALYFCLGHLYGFLWRRAYEERLALLP